jgi:hypothetical protein
MNKCNYDCISVFCCPWHVCSSVEEKLECIMHLDYAVDFIISNLNNRS